MNSNDTLTKIIENAASNRPYDDTFTEFLASYLTANGVSIRPWIDVNDKLPTTDGCFEVTVKNKNGKKHIAICDYRHNAVNKDKKWSMSNVIAWRERDKPYHNP